MRISFYYRKLALKLISGSVDSKIYIICFLVASSYAVSLALNFNFALKHWMKQKLWRILHSVRHADSLVLRALYFPLIFSNSVNIYSTLERRKRLAGWQRFAHTCRHTKSMTSGKLEWKTEILFSIAVFALIVREYYPVIIFVVHTLCIFSLKKSCLENLLPS